MRPFPVTFFAAVPPAAPTGLTAAGGSAQVVLSGYTVAGATSYKIFRGGSSGGETLLASGIMTSTYTDSGLSSGTIYFYYVEAVNSGGISAASNEVSAYTNSVFLTGIQFAYAFETLTTDSSGNGVTLTNTNGVTQGTGIIGNAANLVGASHQTLNVADNAFVRWTSSCTVALWIKPNSLVANTIVFTKMDSNGVGEVRCYIFDTGGQLKLELRAGGSSSSVLGSVLSGTVKVVAGQWNLIILDFDSSALTIGITINNSQRHAGTVSGVPAASTQPFTLGSYAGNDAGWFDGQMDEAIKDNFVWSMDQRTSYWNAGAGRTYPYLGSDQGQPKLMVPVTSGLQLWLQTNVGQTISYPGTVNQLTAWADQSGNGNTVTINATLQVVPAAINGYPSPKFDGLNNWLSCDALGPGMFSGTNQPFTFFCIFQSLVNPTISTFECLMIAANATSGTSTPTHDLYLDGPNSNYESDRRDNAGTELSPNGGSYNTALHYAVYTFDGSLGTLTIDGVQVFSADQGSTLGAMIVDSFTMGAHRRITSGIQDYFNGYLSEIGVFNRAISGAELTSMNAYLKKVAGL
jgi:Concanavalin A-like lectin/glucanases superfamily